MTSQNRMFVFQNLQQPTVLETVKNSPHPNMFVFFLVCRVMIAVCAWYCGLLESAVWPSITDFSSLGFL